MELGGKSPVIVCDDADLDVAVPMCHVGLFLNQRPVVRCFRQESRCQSPNNENWSINGCTCGSWAPGYIEKGKAEGANCSIGGNRHGSKGYFVEPTISTNVSDDMTIAKEEIFGPVMSVIEVHYRRRSSHPS
ncbi:hypothetical protein ACHAXN_010265 [Cyclotella atomus]